MTSRG